MHAHARFQRTFFGPDLQLLELVLLVGLYPVRVVHGTLVVSGDVCCGQQEQGSPPTAATGEAAVAPITSAPTP